MPSLEIDGLGRIHYEVSGRGPAVFFLHSALTDSRQWDKQIAALSDRFCCVCYDLIGSGKSSDSAKLFDPADSLFALMDYLGVSRGHLVGSSVGGSIALHAAIRHSDRIASLFLAGTGMFGYEPDIESEEEPAVYREYEEALSAGNIEGVAGGAEIIWFQGLAGSLADMPEEARRHFAAMNRERLENHPWHGPKYHDIDDAGAVSLVTVPTMVVIGENDTAYCQSLADFLQTNLSLEALHRIPRTAHFPNLTHPEMFNRLLGGWLQRISS